MNINLTSYFRTALAGAFVLLSSAMFAQQNPVISSQNGDRKDKRVNLDLLQATLDTLLSRSETIGDAVSSGGELPTVDWSATLGNSTSPGTDLDLDGYSITNAGSISTTGALTADSLLLTSFGQVAGGFSVGGTLSTDSLVVTEVIWGEFSSISNHTSDSLQEGETHLYFSNSRVLAALDDTLAYLTARIADLDSSAYIFGCTYADALNFDSTATRDDGSCEHILGCIYFAALNYDETATKDDGSCEFEGFGCNDPEALNYDETSDTNDGSCEYPYACSIDLLSYRGVDYTTVLLDGQCWFAENLRATKFTNGDPIADATDVADWTTALTPAYTSPVGEVANVDDWGRLYNYYAIEDTRGLCPTGWHVGTYQDWVSLKDSIGGSNGQKLRSSPTDVPSWNGTNESGFSAVPAGYRNAAGTFSNYDGEAAAQNVWWAGHDAGQIWYARVFDSTNNFLVQSSTSTNATRVGYSVRCVQGEPTTVQQATISTIDATDIAENRVTLSGSVDSAGEGYLSAVGFIWGTDPNLEGASISYLLPSGTSISLELDSQNDGIAASTTYYYAAFGRSEGGIATGDTLSFTTPEPRCGVDPVTFDGFSYSTVLVDDKCWFVENLRTTVFANGDSIDHLPATADWMATHFAAYVNPAGDDATKVDDWGRLYNYHTHEDPRGICPTGWHPSTAEDLNVLKTFVGESNSLKLRSSATDSPSWDGNNESGFSAVPVGYRKWNGDYDGYLGQSSARNEVWGSIVGNKVYNMGIIQGIDDINIYETDVTSFPAIYHQAYSIRCVEGDPATGDLPTASTTSASDTTATTITLSGSIVSDAGNVITAVGFAWGTDPGLADATLTATSVNGTEISVALEGLTPSTTYYYAAFARNRHGYGYGETMSFETTAQLNACADVGGTVTYDGHDYEVVGIGSQCWFAENLQTNVFSDGTAINDGGADGFTESEWMNLSTPASSVYGGPLATYWHDAEYALENWGRIYNGYAVNSTRGICPTGWHVPTVEDWGALGTELGGAPEPFAINWLKYPGVGHVLKEPGVYSSNTYGSFYQDLTHEGSNATGWNGRPSGFRASQNGVFNSATYQGFYAVAGSAMYFETILNQVDAFLKDTSGLKMGSSVRCLKDSE